MRNGHNQYPPMAGVASLRGAIADKIEHLYGRRYDAATEITVTAGATQALLTAILCAVHPGDEVIVIEPTYDSYLPSIELAGGKPVFVTLDAPDYAIPFDRLAAAITPKTRMILINTPHNPTGTVWREADLRRLEEIVRGTNVLILSDEVYEHMVYDGARHESVARYPELAARSFIVSSFGKTFHVTGWKIGYVAAPAALTGIPQGSSVQRVHGEHADAGDRRLSARPGAVSDLPDFYQKKRDFFRAGLAYALQAAAVHGHVLPVRRLFGDQRRVRSGIRQVAHGGDRCGGHSRVGVLSRAARIGRRALLLRQTGEHARVRTGTAGAPVTGAPPRAARAAGPCLRTREVCCFNVRLAVGHALRGGPCRPASRAFQSMPASSRKSRS
jgi:hypothetical protein